MGDICSSYVSRGQFGAFYLFIYFISSARVHCCRSVVCFAAARTVLAVAAAARTPWAALHRTARFCHCAASRVSNTARRRRKPSSASRTRGCKPVYRAADFSVSPVNAPSSVQLIQHHHGAVDKICWSRDMEGPGLKCNQVHGVMVNDDTDELTMTSRHVGKDSNKEKLKRITF